MKIAMFTDIHGNKEALDAILEDCDRRNINLIYSLGDVLGIGPSSIECIDEIINKKIRNCLGNHELYALREKDENEYFSFLEKEHNLWIQKQLTPYMKIKIGGMSLCHEIPIETGSICLCHFPLDTKTYKFHRLSLYRSQGVACFDNIKDKYEKVYFGHEHMPFRKDDKFINLPTSGCVHTNTTSYSILDLETLEIEQVNLEFDREKLVKKIKLGYPNSEYYKRYFGVD